MKYKIGDFVNVTDGGYGRLQGKENISGIIKDVSICGSYYIRIENIYPDGTGDILYFYKQEIIGLAIHTNTNKEYAAKIKDAVSKINRLIWTMPECVDVEFTVHDMTTLKNSNREIIDARVSVAL